MEQPPNIDQARLEYLLAALLQHVEGQAILYPAVFFEGVPMTTLEAFLLGTMFMKSFSNLPR